MEIETLVQGGAVGIALVCLYIIYRMQNGQRQSFIEALDRNSKAFTEFAVAIKGLTDTVGFKTKRRK